MRVSDLNPAQQVAARTIYGPVLILAGAGTGKTRTVTTRICHLLENGVKPDRILAVTFTNKAAQEMKERVKHSTPRGTVSKLTICTFHSLCVRVLREDIQRVGYKPNFTIYTGSDQIGLVKKIIVQKAGKEEKLKPEEAISLWSRQRNKGIPAGADDSLVVMVMREYQRQMKLLNAVDFDDLLVLAVRILDENDDVRASWRAKYDFIMVDEFQDTNLLQLNLMKNVVAAHHNICVVGDDDQSIYGWRGAEITNILEFERHFPNPTIVTLEENYRSTMAILGAANGVIRNNANRRPKKLWSGKGIGEKIRLIGMPGDREEAEFIVEEVVRQQRDEKRTWEDFCILFRTNSQTRVFEELMRSAKIPYRVVGGQSFFDRREIKDVLAYMQVIANPDDDVNFLRIINNPPRGIGDTFVTQATEASREFQESLMATLRRPEYMDIFSARTQTAVASLVEMLDRYRTAVEQDTDLFTVMDSLLTETDYIEYMKRGCKDGEEGLQREIAIRELVGGLRERPQRGTKALTEFLSSISLDGDSGPGQNKNDLEKKAGVSLITMHAAKGLEFPIVYLVGLEEGILPHKRSIEENTRDEERRIFYVGITRAQIRLTLTYCITRVRYRDKVPCLPSSFIRELDPEFIEMTTYDDIFNAPMSDEELDDEFDKLRAMLEADD